MIAIYSVLRGEFTIIGPDKLVPGGALLLYFNWFDNPSGTTYFYFSEDDEAYISSGDVYVTSMKTSDIEDELGDWDNTLTVEVPSTVDVEAEVDYYVKLTDRKLVDQEAIVSEELAGGDNTVEVLAEEDWPTITVDPESGVVCYLGQMKTTTRWTWKARTSTQTTTRRTCTGTSTRAI